MVSFMTVVLLSICLEIIVLSDGLICITVLGGYIQSVRMERKLLGVIIISQISRQNLKLIVLRIVASDNEKIIGND